MTPADEGIAAARQDDRDRAAGRKTYELSPRHCTLIMAALNDKANEYYDILFREKFAITHRTLKQVKRLEERHDVLDDLVTLRNLYTIFHNASDERATLSVVGDVNVVLS